MILDNIKHIFFDLDHTLWDFDRNSALTFEAIFKQENLVIDLPDFLHTYIPINNNYWKLYRENKISKEALRTSRLRDCFNCMEVEMSPEVIENLASNYIKYLPDYNNLIEDAIEVLNYLNKKYELHVITNGFEEVQHLKLLNSKISVFFKTVTTSEEAGVKKPEKKYLSWRWKKQEPYQKRV
nr:HAD hydrolase-like protein [Antarcticibacterium sp. 1MA-6-2]